MIELTRLGKNDQFFLNPDLIERIDCHVDSIVRLTNGIEYVVAESGEQIVDLIVEYRSRIATQGPIVARDASFAPASDDVDVANGANVVELTSNRTPTQEVTP
ncbi:MAG: flagellar FlbD family protein [Ilumatobacter sp.]